MHDVIVAGGGVVGAALVAALAGSRLDVLAVAPDPPPLEAPGDDVTMASTRPAIGRPIALALPARDLLRRLGFLPGTDGTPIRTIHVSQQGRFGRTVLRASDHRLPALGYVFDSATLDAAAARRIAGVRRAGQVLAWTVEDDCVAVHTASDGGGQHIFRARLLVLADGGALAGLDVTRDYQQVAWCGTVRTTVAHDCTAWERFTPDGPLALLPAGDRYAFVWARPSADTALRAADDAAFCAGLHAAFGERLGQFHDVSERFAVPLALRRHASVRDERVVAIGNASQTLHPVAGQGLNLGLRDALALAHHLRRHGDEDIGVTRLTRAYASARALDRGATIGVTDTLVRLFSNDDAFWGIARSIGLSALDACTPARAFLARRMMLGARGLP